MIRLLVSCCQSHRRTGWLASEVKTLPYPRAQAALEQLFGEPVRRLLGSPYGVDRGDVAVPSRGSAFDGAAGLVAVSAERARDFLSSAELTNVGSETRDVLADEVRRLAVAYPQWPLESLLQDIVAVQGRAFGLLEGRQHPGQTVDLYLLAEVTSGLMALQSLIAAAVWGGGQSGAVAGRARACLRGGGGHRARLGGA